MSREYTTEEVREMFLDHLWNLIEYWDSPNLPSSHTQRERLEGVVHSILAAIGGSCGGSPAFILAPYPHPDDRLFYESQGENWWPENENVEIKSDIGRNGLHGLMYAHKRKKENKN